MYLKANKNGINGSQILLSGTNADQSNQVIPDHGNTGEKFACFYSKSNPGGGALQLHLYGGVWPQYWKIDPSAD